MLSKQKSELLKQLVDGCNNAELAWTAGYITGLLQIGNEQTKLPSQKPLPNKITIAYGTETGNAKKLASDFAVKARKNGLNPKVVSLDQYKGNDLSKEEYFFTVISTQGDGEPPAGAKKFYDHIHNNGFKVNGLKYAVLALGDTSYPLFCKAGEDVDIQLNKLGGQRFLPLQKCDIDYEYEADNWFTKIIENLSAVTFSPKTVTTTTKKTTGKKIHQGKVTANINLNDVGSNKQTHHIEVEIEDIDYLPGDSLGIIPENPTHLVNSILEIVNIEPNKKILFRTEELMVKDLITKKLNIVYLSERVLNKYALLTGHDIPLTKIGLLDLLRIYPFKKNIKFEEIIELLEPITPRLYSISSSPEAHPGEIHLTVARDTFDVNGEIKYGLCSDFFSQMQEGYQINFYIHKNNQFRLPADDKDIIMIGPGTGIAPFRSFVAQREAIGSIGRNWLFFGDQHFVTDFLYQSELLNWLDTGILQKLNVAFSRDQKQKVYVQHKMQEHGFEMYEWLENGAYFYICGAKEPMSIDVENMLISIIEKYRNCTYDQAIEYVNKLKEEGRYLKDVY